MHGDRISRASYLGLVVVLTYLTAGMTTEVTHLVFTASFYALMVAAFGAVALPPPPEVQAAREASPPAAPAQG